MSVFRLSRVGSGLATGLISGQGVLTTIYNSVSKPVVGVPLGVRENNIGNGGKHQEKRVKK
jgi:hypothetical protein